jgi:sugar lactone lactonase YvrE
MFLRSLWNEFFLQTKPLRTVSPRKVMGSLRTVKVQLEQMEDRLCPSPVLLVTDGFNAVSTNEILKFDGSTGSFLSTFVAPNTYLANPDLGMVQGPDGNIYKENFGAGSVLRFDLVTGDPRPADGQSGANFVPPGSGGLSGTEGIAFGADGNLYVASTNTDSVLEYNGTTGAFITTFIASGTGTLHLSNDLKFGPDGHLYVDNFDGSGEVLRFDENTGAPLPGDIGVAAWFINPGDGGLLRPNGFDWGPDGNLYVANADASSTAPRILRYSGTTGAFMDVFVAADPSIGFIDAISWGPDGNLYITSTISGGTGVTGLLSFAPDGTPLGVFGDTASSGLTSAAGLLFYDDGTGPRPHGGSQHHAQLDTLLLPASTLLSPSAGAVQDGPAVHAASTASVSPLSQPTATHDASIRLLPGSWLPAAAHGAFAPEAIFAGLTPAAIDPLFGQVWSGGI